jgi:predicted nucleic acid-binding protein
MTIVISDTNVFVALFRCDLLFKVFSIGRVRVVIPTEIYNELTAGGRRVGREYPDLSALIIQLVSNPNHGHPISISVFNYNQGLDDTEAIECHYLLEEEASLDKGERQAIPLAIQLSATFVSCDAAAIDEYESRFDGKNGSSAHSFDKYCESLKEESIITQEELKAILVVLRQ